MNVYIRYTRLFLDDDVVREAYHNEIERFEAAGEDVTEWWMDTIQWELDFGTLQMATDMLRKNTRYGFSDSLPIFKAFHPKHVA